MSHSVSEAAARAVKNSQKKVEEKRTPEEIIKGIRGNLAAHLAVTPNDTAFLLAAYDSERSVGIHLKEDTASLLVRAETAEAYIQELRGKIEEFRLVYEQENRNMAVQVAQCLDDEPQAVVTVFRENSQPSVEPLIVLASAVSGALCQDHDSEV